MSAVRVVDTNEYVDVLRGLVEDGREVNMLISGSSMSPFLIHGRDHIRFRKPEAPLRAGDMVFYQRDDGRYIMHRILRVRGGTYDIVGDNQTQIERGVRRDQIFAIVTAVQRRGVWMGPGSFWWEFFRRVWPLLLPLRPAISRGYAVMTGKRKHKKAQESISEHK